MKNLQIDYIKENLRTRSFGQKLFYFEKLVSTSDQLWEMAKGELPHGTMVIAEQQKAGRGRQGNSWYSPPSVGLYFSLFLKPGTNPLKFNGLTLMLGNSAASVMEEESKTSIEIKWPNDIYCRGRKLGGILTETRVNSNMVEQAVVGIGLNLNNDFLPLELCETATSLKLETGQHIFREDLLIKILARAEEDYQKFMDQGLAPFLVGIAGRSYLNQRWVQVRDEDGAAVKGLATGIDAQGALLLIDDQGKDLRCVAGTVQEIEK
jgi:BirA family biotin operon repressor/biotin-[acetyl-CoA-carboxylase] ligase